MEDRGQAMLLVTPTPEFSRVGRLRTLPGSDWRAGRDRGYDASPGGIRTQMSADRTLDRARRISFVLMAAIVLACACKRGERASPAASPAPQVPVESAGPASPEVEAAVPPGAMYAFFRVKEMPDSLAFCKRMVREFGLGLAPGIAFGPEGEGYLRWCFAASPERLAEGMARFEKALRGTRSHA